MLERAIPLYRQRLNVRPGVTGLAQVQLPPDTDLDSVRIKLAYDLHYIRHQSLLLDSALYLATLGKLVGLSEGTIRKLCRLSPRDVAEREYQGLVTPSARTRSENLGLVPTLSVGTRRFATLPHRGRVAASDSIVRVACSAVPRR